MSHFCLLRDPETYIAHDWDLLADETARRHWLDLFEKHFADLLQHAAVQYGRAATRPIANAARQFAALIQQLRENPACLPGGKLNIIEMVRQREKVLRSNRLNDPFGHVNERENAKAMQLYPQVVRKLHALEPKAKWLNLIESVYAGNIFDMGSPATMNLANDSPDFLKVVQNTKPRPWLVDHYDALASTLVPAPPTKWSKAVIFVDNAGSDFILGVMPLAREMALCGTKMVLAANEIPSLNDITVNECIAIVQRLAALDGDLEALIGAGMFEVVSSGNDIPLIDLSEVSDELNEAAADAELVILEGMGRAIESNYNAAFKVDALHLALLKDPLVASRVGGVVYDCICKYTPATA